MISRVLHASLASVCVLLSVATAEATTLDFASLQVPSCPGHAAYPPVSIQGATITSAAELSVCDLCWLYGAACGQACGLAGPKTSLASVCTWPYWFPEINALPIRIAFDPSLHVRRVSVDGRVTDYANMGLTLYDSSNHIVGHAAAPSVDQDSAPPPTWPFTMTAEANSDVAYSVVEVTSSPICCSSECTCDAFILFHAVFGDAATPVVARSWGRLKTMYR